MKKIIALLLVLVLAFSCTACSGANKGEPTKIKFSQSIEDLKKHDGKTVEINGFMSLLSPLNGEIFYLMNIPLQNCPFCVPNTTTLSNTIAIKGSGIEFTEKPIKVTGTLVFDNFSDDYGYEYEFRIQDAQVVELDEKEVSDKMKVYYTLIENDCIAILYTMCMFIDQAAYYEEYELTPDDIIADGILNFDEYEAVHNTLTSLNTNGEYDKFISAFETANKYRLEVNEAINTGNVEKLPEFKDAADMCVDNFFKFISEYEF